MEIKSSKLLEPIPPSPEPLLSIVMDKALPKGAYVFRLVVEDDATPPNVSLPTEHVVIVLDDERPTAIITRDGNVKSPSMVGFGKPFKLSGEKSTDLGGGTIKKYTWKMTQEPSTPTPL